MSYANIPHELQLLPQWVVWRFELTDDGKQTKVPYNARTGFRASHSDRSSWSTFEEALASSSFYSGIGFVFTAFDPYCGIDLDATEDEEATARQVKILDAFNSYAEWSPSGKGIHIIVKAQIPHGRKRASIEIYDKERYFTFTGNVYKNLPITDQQQLVTQLWEEMGPQATPSHYVGDVFPKHADEEVYNQALAARNGETFLNLWNGNWRNDYPSQSQADQALMNILAYYTKNRAQLSRLFRMSALGQRDKAKRDKYMQYTIDKAFDMTLPPIDLSALIDNIQAAIAANKREPQQAPVAQAAPVIHPHRDTAPPSSDLPDLWRQADPPGVLSDVMKFILAASPRPVREIALTASLGLLAGICGRAYNVSGDGLNVYLMLLAETGRGKEAMSRGINRLIGAVASNNFPAAWDFIGPSDMASGAGLLRHLSEHPQPSFVSLTGEIGMRLQQMSHPSANMADRTLQRILLDIFAKSGAGQVARPSVYSDKKNNVPNINSPAFTWLGESTPSEFYKALTEHQISSGLLPRFLIIDYQGPRVDLSPTHANAYPSQRLIDQMGAIITASLEINQTGKVVNVGMTAEAAELSSLIDLYCTHKINEYNAGPLVHLWNRAHLNTLKLAALLAVSLNHFQPMIDANMLRWAQSLVMHTVKSLTDKFESGEIAKSPKQEGVTILARGVVSFMEGRRNMKPTEQALFDAGVISRSTMVQMVAPYVVYKTNGKLFDEVLTEMEKQGVVVKLSKQDAIEKFNTRAELYQVSNAQWFYDNAVS